LGLISNLCEQVKQAKFRINNTALHDNPLCVQHIMTS